MMPNPENLIPSIPLEKWFNNLKYNPVAPLLNCGNAEIVTFIRQDILDNPVSVEDLWQLAGPQKILKNQQPNGSWLYPGVKEDIRIQENYNQYETFKNLGILIEEFGFNKKHPAITQTAEYLFSNQTEEGDFRGIYGNQYSPNYSAGIAELLIKAGYADDTRIRKLFHWLLAIRQNDCGWAIPFRTQSYGLDVIWDHSKTIQPDASKPSSYMVTGVVLRAFAAHPTYRKSHEAHQAGTLLHSGLFEKDQYPDRAGAAYWLRFSFPFYYTDLISALDTLSCLEFPVQEPHIQQALQWFVENQQKTGLWQFKITKGKNKDILELWLAFAVCRIFKRFFH
ncbi:MAG: hypothetical protein STSR0009_12350 [Methanoregula sp.]